MPRERRSKDTRPEISPASRGAGSPLPREVLRVVAVALVALLGRGVLADHYHVPTGSMEPTVEVGDHIFVDKHAYGLRVPLTNTYLWQADDPQPGHVVVLDSPVGGEVLLKRVVAVPGDLMQVANGQLVRNGHPVSLERRGDGIFEHLGERAHPLALTPDGGPNFGPVRLGDDEYLVMGDNRGQSYDGRMFGAVRRGDILGRARYVIFGPSGLEFRRL